MRTLRPRLPGRGLCATGVRAQAVTALWLLLAACGSAAAQDLGWGSASSYVNITSAKVERLSNAVRVILTADGTLQASLDPAEYWGRNPDTGRWELKYLRRMSMGLLNARSQIGRFVDVGIYPVSHITLSVPTEATEGVGLLATLSLYQPARVGKISAWGAQDEWGQWWQEDLLVDMILSDNARELIITVHSDVHFDTDTPEDAVPQAAERVQVDRAADGVRLRAVNAPFDRVVDEIAACEPVAVSVGPGVAKRITASLPPMPAADVIRLLCRVNCLSLREDAGRLIVSQGSTDDIGSYWASETRRIHLEHIRADDALVQLPNFILRFVRSDPGGNDVVATGPPVLLDKIQRDLVVLDRPAKEIRIRSLVVEIVRPEEVRRKLALFIAGGNTLVRLAPDTGNVSIGVSELGLDEIRASLHSLAQRGAVRMRVEPEIRVLSGRVAELFIGKRQYYPFLRPTWWGGSELRVRNVEIGTHLVATPWAGGDDIVMVPYEISSGSITSQDKNGIPTVSRQRAEGTVRMQGGDTLVFGGLQSTNDEVEHRSGMPLNWLPGVRNLTESLAHTTHATEVVVCITAQVIPYVGVPKPPDAADGVPGDEGNSPAAEQRRQQTAPGPGPTPGPRALALLNKSDN